MPASAPTPVDPAASVATASQTSSDALLPPTQLDPSRGIPPATANPSAAPAAIIYVPSVGQTVDADAVDGLARRVARALDYRDDEVDATYSVRAAAPETYGVADSTAEVREIVLTKPGQEPVVTHRVYHLGYHSLLEAKKRSNVFLQAFDILSLCLVLGLRYAIAWRRKSLGFSHKLTLLVAGVCLAVMCLYAATTLGFLASAAVPGADTAVAQATGQIKSLVRERLPVPYAWVADTTRPLRQILENYVTHFIVILGSLGLTMTAAREALDRAGRSFMRFGRYVTFGEGRACCTGQFNALLEHVVSQKPSRIDVIGYSMGSLVVLDSLFPGKGVAPSRAHYITTISTIGCPFDLVRTLWPAYFSNRTDQAPSLPWINVYSPVDLLGSNFTNATGVQAAPTHGINGPDPSAQPADSSASLFRPVANVFYDQANRTDIDVVDAALLRGFSAHGQYWVPGSYEAESCFTTLVPLIYREDWSRRRAAVFPQPPAAAVATRDLP